MLRLIILLLRYLLPQPAVDPQCPLQAEATADAGDAAAQRAAHGEEAALHLRHGLQARLAECVSAVEKPWDPLGARVGQEAHATFALLTQDHGGRGWEERVEILESMTNVARMFCVSFFFTFCL